MVADDEGEDAVRVSINITDHSWPDGPGGLAARLAETARGAEEAGVHTVWVGDHLLQSDPTSEPHEPVLEAYTTLGFLASATSTVRLGTMVSWASIRPPALLVKAVTTVDVLSGGRAALGLGAGYHAGEAADLGLPFPGTAERFELLEDTLRAALHLWAGDERPFHGTHVEMARPIARPAPLSRPRPPILVGGMGERRTIPLVARYADACNFFDVPDGGATLRHKLDVLARACEAAGRDPADVERTVSTRLDAGESAASFTDRCAALAALGFGHAVLVTSGPWTDRALATIAEAGAGVAAIDHRSDERSTS